MKKLILVLGAIALIAIISIITVNQKFNNYLARGGVNHNPEGTIFISRQSPLMVSLLVNPEKLSAIGGVLPLNGEQKKVFQAVEQLRTKLLNKVQVDDVQELKNWLGDEITLAVTSLDLDKNRDNGAQPGYLLVVKNKDSNLAREFLQNYYAKQAVSSEAKLIFDNYQGVNIVYQKPLGENPNIQRVAAAVIADYVLFANDLSVLQEAINNAQAINLNLEHYQPYQSALATITKPKVSLAYINIPSTSAWITNQPLPEEDLIEQTLTLSLAVNQQGLIASTALSGVAGEENQPPSLTTAPSALNYIPANSIFAASGIKLDQFWQQISDGLKNNSPLQQIVNQSLNPLQKSSGLNFGEDIFPKVTGEYALSLSVDEVTKNLNWLFVNQTDSNSLSDTLDDIAQDRGLSVGDLPLADNTITAWTKLVTTSENSFAKLEAQVKGVHAQVMPYEIITNSVDVLGDILANPAENLLHNSEFQSTIKALPSENDGYLYVQWQDLEPYLNRQFPIVKVMELGFKPLFDNLQSLTITSEGSKNGVKQATIFLNLVSE
ncbi:DUF3352 domain-containing protein [Cyanobacterium stanieri LEGE 03274]|uniref:DUF3352 domain-containing protein n=1 Tax=Cyanobacterium stanieri LEGE 03274 TaxID=1828756 RepID=A0ABR9V9G5_9CHRO|nr:DUF3352 domain-containing protein [Cyanobacterium stanieri]MBE9223489.1 DUF3352 domain-containing protein [Cyanobacterium stanieri LEGE 03274]